MNALQAMALGISFGIPAALVVAWWIIEWVRDRSVRRVSGAAPGTVMVDAGDLERYRRSPVEFLKLFPDFAPEPWQTEALEKLVHPEDLILRDLLAARVPAVGDRYEFTMRTKLPEANWRPATKQEALEAAYPLPAEEALARADAWVQPDEPHFLSELQAEALRKMREDPDWSKEAIKPGVTMAYFGRRWYDQDGEHEICESDEIYRWHSIEDLIP